MLALLADLDHEAWKYSDVKKAVGKLSLVGRDALWVVSGADLASGKITLSGEQKITLLLEAADQNKMDASLKIEIADNAAVTIFERQAGQGAYWKNITLDISVGKNACVDYYRMYEDDSLSVVTQVSTVDMARDARFNLVALSGSAAFVRNEWIVNINGEGAEADLCGLCVLGDKRHADTTVLVNHLVPHGKSSQFFKTVLRDAARGVYQGKIHVHKDAQKTDGFQMSNHLLLSPLAEMDVKPELEIYADDVKCSHGSTTGELDETPLFYLRSRGLSVEEARKLLLDAFMNEILDKVRDEDVRERMISFINSPVPHRAREES